MGIETFSKAKDVALIALLVFIAGIAVDTRNTVIEMASESVLLKYQISIIQQDVEQGKKNDEKHTNDITEIKAILNRDDYKQIVSEEDQRREK